MSNRIKKLIVIILMSLLLLSLIGCSSQENPEDTVENFFNFAKSFRLSSIKNSFDDLEGDTEEFFESISEGQEFPDYLSEYLKENAKKIEYNIIDSEIENSRAIVKVDVKYIDGGKLIRESFGEVFRTILAESDGEKELSDEELDELFVETMKEKQRLNKEKIIEKEVMIKLVESRGKWYIEEMTEDLADIIMSGFIRAMEDI